MTRDEAIIEFCANEVNPGIIGAFILGWEARQRHDAEIAREWSGTEANADTIADAIERSE